MPKKSNKPIQITADNFVKLLAKKDTIEKEISKLHKKLDKVKGDLKPFKQFVDDLTK